MKQLRKNDLRQWLWANLSSPVNTGIKTASDPLHTFADIRHVQMPQTLPTWARQFVKRCNAIDGTVRGAEAYHILREILGDED